MKIINAVFIMLGILALSACDNTPPKSKIENPLAGHVEALDKAKALEGQILDAAEKQRKAIDEMTK